MDALGLGKVADGTVPDDQIDSALGQLNLNWDVLIDPTRETLEAVARDTGMEALGQLRIQDDGITDLVHQDALDFAEARAAELIGKRINAEGEVVDNPSPGWSIGEATRDMLRSTVVQAVTEGMTNDEIAAAIEDAHAFSAERAMTIARTETSIAHNSGAMTGYRAAREIGVVVRKEWLLGEEACDECSENAAEGPIDLDEDFPSGDDAPPAHPNCRCAVSPVVVDDPRQADEANDAEE